MSLSLRPVENLGVRWFAVGHFDRWRQVLAVASSRNGGVSLTGKATLNLSYAVGDTPERVAENRRRLAEALSIDGQRVVCAAQVHGAKATVVDETNGGAGFLTSTTAIPDVDALATDQTDLFLWLGFADCVPIVIYDPERPAIGVAHAGWRGTLREVSRSLVTTMQAAFQSRPAALWAALGPAIGPCCYEVGKDVEAAFRDNWGNTPDDLFHHFGARRHLNLWEANRHSLEAAGVPPSHISISGACTSCQPSDFFSHRAQRGQAGRFAVIVGLREGE
ncbi:MAG TPA: peptidoglycan editing factor PgeF [Chloroflexota bacterium]|nr:peptidoglycan editing factor PgeF [Chloroflexota bacterium]